jgi:hypothetical protein
VKYMILVQSNPNFQQRWEALPDAERESFGRRHLALDRELAESGELILSEALADPSKAKRVTSVDGRRTMTTDGPFAEAKEHLAGFYLVDCDTEERALDIAARVPDAVWGLAEVRPLLDTSTWDA